MLIANNVPTYNLFFALQQEDNFDFKNDDANRIKKVNDNFINFTKKRVTGHQLKYKQPRLGSNYY